MQRSLVNQIIDEAMAFCRQQNFHLPPFAFWSPDDWRRLGPQADAIRQARLGWDVTDFGQGRFEQLGLVLFTLRNGWAAEPEPKTYCEKILIVRPGQQTPLHFHWRKMEDLINRGGGVLVLRLFAAGPDDRPDTSRNLRVRIDGLERSVQPAGTVALSPGESITLPTRLFHSFWAQPDSGPVLIGEVSQVNDDQTDNCFAEPVARFPTIEHDAPARYLLCHEYPLPGQTPSAV